MSQLPPDKEQLAWRMAALYVRFFNAWAGEGPLPDVDPADHLRSDPAYDDDIERRLYELIPMSEVLWRVRRVRGIKAWA